ncbi:WecB/TagA/CpsF family glycosyltransferase [Blastococcus sp. SYSU D00669]
MQPDRWKEVPLPPSSVTEFGDIPLWLGSLQEAAQMVLSNPGAAQSTSFRLINAYSLYCADQTPMYRDVLRGPGVNFIDGKPLALAMRRWNKGRNVEQVRGPSLFEYCLDKGRSASLRHFLLGGTPDLLEQLIHALEQRYPGILITGSYSPPFKRLEEDDREEFRDHVRRADPDIVWVGLGTPKQDVEAADLTRSLRITSVAVGAAFDFSAGRKPEAPRILKALALEWVFRLYSEPSRLWRRYLFGNTFFIGLLLRHGAQRKFRRSIRS